jgi:hypothetical protein
VLNLVPQLHLGYHLALYRSMSVQGVVYDDRDRDGQRDAGEAGVRDVLVHSVIAIGTFGDHPTLTTQTAPDGSFVIKDVPVNPAVDVDLQLSGTFIRSKMLSVHVDPANLTPLQVPVRVFGGITGSTVQLTKSGRQLLKGVHVYADRNNNRKHDENEPWTTSDQSGIYWLTPVTGEFTLRLLKKYRDLSLLSPLNLKSARPGQWIINDMVFLG